MAFNVLAFRKYIYPTGVAEMATNYILADQISPLTTKRAIHLRCVRYYEIAYKNKGSILPKTLEVLFHDEKVWS